MGGCFFGSFPVCHTGDAIKHYVLAVTRERRSLGEKGCENISLVFVLSFTVMDDKNVAKLNELIQQG